MSRFFSNKWNKIEIITTLSIAIGLITFIHFKKRSDTVTQPLAYIQLGEHPWLVHVQNTLEPIANEIIKDEILAINPTATNIPTLYIKKRNIITLLYSQPFNSSLYDLLIEKVQTSVQNFQEPISKIYFSNHIDWFGRNKSELVIKIHDPSHYLHKLRDCILKGLQDSNSIACQSLYNALHIQESNNFDYTPHESIGRIDIQKIEQLSNNQTVEKIKHQITGALKKIIDTMHQSNEIIPSQLELYGNEFKTIATMDNTLDELKTAPPNILNQKNNTNPLLKDSFCAIMTLYIN